jgi:hypothetical protein
MKNLWARLGITITDVTEEELNCLKVATNNEAMLLLKNWIDNDRISVSGETYFPADVNGLEEDLEFELY